MRHIIPIIVLIITQYAPDAFACNSRIVVDGNKPLQVQFSRVNTTYCINSTIDLNGISITIPRNSKLVFNGGKFINGTIVGNNTILEGDIQLHRVKGSYSSPFKSSFSSISADEEKLRMLLSLRVDDLTLDENFHINSFTGQINSVISSVHGDAIQIDINVDCCIDGHLRPFINFEAPIVELSGLTLDFHKHACRNAIFVTRISDTSSIHNLSFKNIDIRHVPVANDTYIQGLTVIADRKAAISIKSISAINLKSNANGVVGDASGNITAVYVYLKKNVPSIISISDCYFTELHNYDSNGDIVPEDTNGIYVHESTPISFNSRVEINDIYGINFGKRLIKADAGNIHISHVTAFSKYKDTLSAISLNNSNSQFQNASISDIRFSGTAKYVVGSAVPETIIQNIDSEITIAPDTYSAAIFPMSSCVVKHLRLRGAQQIAFIVETDELVEIEDVDYDDTSSSHDLYGKAPIIVADAQFSMRGIRIISNKIAYLMAEYGPQSNRYHWAAKADIRNLTATLGRETKDWFFYMGGAMHSWDISIVNSNLSFVNEIRAPFCIQGVGHHRQIALSVKNTKINYNRVSDTTIPFGWFEVDQNTSVLFDNCEVFNHSGNNFAPGIHGMYLINKSESPILGKISIYNCRVDGSQLSTDGRFDVSVIGERINWKR